MRMSGTRGRRATDPAEDEEAGLRLHGHGEPVGPERPGRRPPARRLDDRRQAQGRPRPAAEEAGHQRHREDPGPAPGGDGARPGRGAGEERRGDEEQDRRGTFFDDNRQFLNQAFSTSPTIALPLRGAGAVGTFFPKANYYVMGGVYSANSSDTGWTIDEVFDTGELFYQVEVGWSALARSGVPAQARGPMDSDNVHLTFWYKDDQPDATNPFMRPDSKGVAFDANMTVNDDLMWFVRAGMSDGWASDRAAAAGFGWRPSEHFSDLFGFGVGWVRPNADVLPEPFQREQWNVEAFYRFHLTPNLAITPDLQYIKDPSLNPGVDDLWVTSLRARITF